MVIFKNIVTLAIPLILTNACATSSGGPSAQTQATGSASATVSASDSGVAAVAGSSTSEPPAKFNLDRQTVVALDGLLRGKGTKIRLKRDVKCQEGACAVPGTLLNSTAPDEATPFLTVTSVDTGHLLREMKLAKKKTRLKIVSGNRLECSRLACTVTFKSTTSR